MEWFDGGGVEVLVRGIGGTTILRRRQWRQPVAAAAWERWCLEGIT